jgi:hypothetical protein
MLTIIPSEPTNWSDNQITEIFHTGKKWAEATISLNIEQCTTKHIYVEIFDGNEVYEFLNGGRKPNSLVYVKNNVGHVEPRTGENQEDEKKWFEWKIVYPRENMECFTFFGKNRGQCEYYEGMNIRIHITTASGWRGNPDFFAVGISEINEYGVKGQIAFSPIVAIRSKVTTHKKKQTSLGLEYESVKENPSKYNTDLNSSKMNTYESMDESDDMQSDDMQSDDMQSDDMQSDECDDLQCNGNDMQNNNMQSNNMQINKDVDESGNIYNNIEKDDLNSEKDNDSTSFKSVSDNGKDMPEVSSKASGVQSQLTQIDLKLNRIIGILENQSPSLNFGNISPFTL